MSANCVKYDDGKIVVEEDIKADGSLESTL